MFQAALIRALVAFVPLAESLKLPGGGQEPLSSVHWSKGLTDIPHLGFGTWNLSPKDHNASAAVSHAIQTGYRHIDCAAAYFNEKDVGRGIKEGLAKAGLRREDILVTSKILNDK